MDIDVMKCKVVRESELPYGRQTVEDPDEVYRLLQALGLNEASEEYFYMLCLNTKSEVVGVHEVSHGDLTSTMVSPREVFKRALVNNAYGIIVAHNHPSGDATPSEEDVEATNRLVEAGKLLGITLLDHLIVGEGYYESMRNLDYIQ